jgi:hypothetical protein
MMKRFIPISLLVLWMVITGCAMTEKVPAVHPATSAEKSATQPAASATGVSETTSMRNPTGTASQAPPTHPYSTPTSQPKHDLPTQTASLGVTRATPTYDPEAWRALPVIPEINEAMLEIFQQGVELGNNPQAFSKIGDCGSTPAWFLGDFDLGSKFYDLGPYPYLERVIQEFQGSFGRTSLAARAGFNASSLFVSLWSDRSQCLSKETPLACEFRNQRPIMVFVMLGTNDVYHPEQFEPQMRKLIEFSLENGVIPILSTKADNLEKDQSINATIARLAGEYRVPLWNFWLAVQALPDQGLQEDKAHLTWGRNFFDDPEAMNKAWTIRNLTALQMLDAVWKKLTSQAK